MEEEVHERPGSAGTTVLQLDGCHGAQTDIPRGQTVVGCITLVTQHETLIHTGIMKCVVRNTIEVLVPTDFTPASFHSFCNSLSLW